MRSVLILRSLVSGLCVYVLAAACSASERTLLAPDAGGASGGAFADAVTGEVGSPVHDAKAEPLSPDVSTEPCTKIRNYAGQDWYVAEHAYPGKTVNELALVRSFYPGTTMEGATHLPGFVAMRDGLVISPCVTVSAGPPGYSMTFVLPR